METFKLHSLLAELKEADRWLADLGFKTRNDRLRQSIEVVKEAAQGFETAGRTGHPTKVGTKDNYYFGLVEALELRSVYRAFNEVSPQTVCPPLKRALSGPSRPPMENKGNAAGRNAMFELALAAEWKLRGAEVSIGEPDIVLIGADHSFVVECKRPWSDHNIRPNIRDAAEQLSVKVDGSAGSFGVIAISVSRVLDKSKSLFVVPSGEDAGTRLLEEHVVQLFQREKVQWNAAWFGLPISSLLFHAAVAAVFGGTVVRATSTVASHPVGRRNEGSPLFERELIRLYGDDVTVG